jgi:hypothetical protein
LHPGGQECVDGKQDDEGADGDRGHATAITPTAIASAPRQISGSIA